MRHRALIVEPRLATPSVLMVVKETLETVLSLPQTAP